MELRHLRYFVAVAEELNFGRAARRLNIAQPPLSRQIKALEAELGVRLLVRSKRRVQLTDAGRIFLGEACTAIQQAERAADRARRAGRGETGRLSIALPPAADGGLVPRVIPPFVARHPDVQLELHSLDPEQHVVALQAGTIEVGLLPLPVSVPDTIAVEPLFAEELCAVFHHGHRLAARQRVSIGMLAAEPLVLFARHVAPRLHDGILGMLRDAGVAPGACYHASHLHTCIALVAARLGIGLLPASIQVAPGPRVVYRRIVGAVPRLEIGIAYREDDPSQLLHDFLASTRAAFSGARVALLTCGRREEPPRARWSRATT